MKNKIRCFLSLVFICTFVGTSLDINTFDVYASESVEEEFSIELQDEQELSSGQKVTKGKKLVLKIIGSIDNKEDHKEKNTYNFYYTVPGDNKRVYIAKNIKDAYIWNTYNVEKIGELEIHMTINEYTESEIKERLCNKTVKLNIVDVYEITYLSNYANSNLYAMKFYCEDKKSITIKGYLFEREGYYLDGWNDKPDASGTDYKVGKEYFPNKNLTLYAIWKQQKTVKVPNNMKKAQTARSTVTDNITGIMSSAKQFISKNPVSAYANDSKKNINTKKAEEESKSVKPELTEGVKASNSPTGIYFEKGETKNIVDKPSYSKDMATEQVASISADKADINTSTDENLTTNTNKENTMEGNYIAISIIVFLVGMFGAYIYKRYNKKRL